MHHFLYLIDQKLLPFVRSFYPWSGRIALFIVFFWFGVLKVIGVSPASGIVGELQMVLLPTLPTDGFIIFLGIAEIVIGFLILIPKWERLSVLILILHMITTFVTLVALPEATWQSFLVPTLEGQYVLKNLVIVALALGFAAHLTPLEDRPELVR